MKLKHLIFAVLLLVIKDSYAQIKIIDVRQIGFQEEDYYIEQLANGDVVVNSERLDTFIFSSDSFIFITDTVNAINKELYYELYPNGMPLLKNYSLENLYSGELKLYHPNGKIKLQYAVKNGRLQPNASLWDENSYPIFTIKHGPYSYYNLVVNYYPNSFMIKDLTYRDDKKSWYENGIMQEFYDAGNNLRTKWDTTGNKSYYSCSQYSKQWDNGKLIEHSIYDTLGLYRFTYEFLNDGYRITKQGFSKDSDKVYWINELYNSNSVLLSIDSVFEGPEETDEVFEYFYVNEMAIYHNGLGGLQLKIRELFENQRVNRLQKGRYSIRIEIDERGSVGKVEIKSTAKRNAKISNKLEQFFLETVWRPHRVRDKGVKSKMLITIMVT